MMSPPRFELGTTGVLSTLTKSSTGHIRPALHQTKLRAQFSARQHIYTVLSVLICDRRESNPRHSLGKAELYHLTTIANICEIVNGPGRFSCTFYKSCTKTKRSLTRRVFIWARPDSNRRPSPCKGDVITTKPRALLFLNEILNHLYI